MSGILKNILKPPFKHKKLSEDFASLEQTLCADGVSFACRELGSTFVTEAQEESTTADAIRRIVHAARVSNLKPRRVTLHISSSGVRIQCAATAEIILETDIYNVTYCSADAHYNHVFAFITTVDRNAYECHAYLCHSAKAARTISFAIAQSFSYLAQKYCKDASEIVTEDNIWDKLPQRDSVSPTETEDLSTIEAKTNNLIQSLQSLSMESRDAGSDASSLSLGSDLQSLDMSEKLSLDSGDHLKSKSSNNINNSIRKNWAAFEQDSEILSEEMSFSASNPDFGDPTLRYPAECQLSCSATSDRDLRKKIPNTGTFLINQMNKQVTSSNSAIFPESSAQFKSEDSGSKSLNFLNKDAQPKTESNGPTCKMSQWETFNNSSPLSSFDDMWELSSSYKGVNGNSNWACFTD